MINVEKILIKLDIDFLEYTEITGGRDGAVWKVITKDHAALALRLLDKDRVNHLSHEQTLMKLAFHNNIPTPEVHHVKIIDGYAVMLMDWVEGKTVVAQLMDHPESAFQLGVNYGKVQAKIHLIDASKVNPNYNWLTPKSTQEKELLEAIHVNSNLTKSLIHLDYHPLNVMAKGSNISGVIDWTNASIGDYRFDLARTYSILELEGRKVFDPSSLSEFLSGWEKGYTEKMGPLENMNLFYKWAGERMKNDMAASLTKEDLYLIDSWINKWSPS